LKSWLKQLVVKQKNLFYKYLNLSRVKTSSYQTISANNDTVVRKWWVVDAEGQVVGRLSSKIAHVLRGKHKPSFTPHVDCGDYIIVINAGKIRFTGNKVNQKEYISYSLYPGGQKREVAKNLLARKPIAIIENAVKGMLPKTKLGSAMFTKLFVYEGAEHNHQAQKPEELK
jgi:large subunit ribosomal protein L13